MAHETVTELRDEILAKSQDSSFTLAHIIRFLNQGLQEVSARVQLPALVAIDGTTITTSASANSVALPTDFQRNLYKCHSITRNTDVKIYSSPAALDKLFSEVESSGSVIGVCEYGANLYYQKRAAEALHIYYMKEPTLLTVGTSQPTDLPMEHVRGLLVNFALKEIFMNKREFDVAAEYRRLYENEVAILSQRLGAERKPATEVEDALNLDCLY